MSDWLRNYIDRHASVDALGRENVAVKIVRVESDHIKQLASVLTGYGVIVGIDHEGVITYEIEAADEVKLGRFIEEIRQELLSYDTGIEIKEKDA